MWGRIALSPDGRWLAALHANQEIRLCDRKGTTIRTFTGPTNCSSVTFSRDGKLLAVGDLYYRGNSPDSHGRVFVWETATGRLVITLPGEMYHVRTAIFSPDGKSVAIASNSVCVWNLATGKLTQRFPPRTGTEVLVYTHDGRFLIGGREGVVNWEVASGEEQLRLGGEHGMVAAATLSPDGRFLATAGTDGVVRLWDFPTAKMWAELTGHTGKVCAVAFSPDGSILATGGEDTTILLWDVPGAVRPRGKPSRVRLSRAELDRLWGELGMADVAAGKRAIWTLVDGAAEATAFLEEKLREHSQRADGKSIARWIADLDDDSFATREKATQELDKLGRDMVPALRTVLADNPSLEAVRRIEQLLRAHGGRSPLVPAGAALRQFRAVQVLELIATKEAAKVLQGLRDGSPTQLGVDAREALQRLDRRMRGPR